MTHESGAADDLRTSALFSACSPADIARLMPALARKKLDPGQDLFRAGAAARETYLVRSGQVRLKRDQAVLQDCSRGLVGEEAGLGLEAYACDAVAATAVDLWVIPGDALRGMVSAAPSLRGELCNSLLSHFGVSGAPDPSPGPAERRARPTRLEWAGWLLAVAVPAAVYWLAANASFGAAGQLFLTVMSSVVVLWVFQVVPEFIPCILGVIALIAVGVAPPMTVLAGFSSSEFFLAMSVFGVGAVAVASGLSYRAALLLLRRMPAGTCWYYLALYLLGLVTTPIVPVANGRVSLATPLLVEMVRALKCQPRGKLANGLAAATFTGFTVLSAVFLTAKPINFVVYGLLPQHVRAQFEWGGWLLAGSACGLTLLAGSMVLNGVFFRSAERPTVARDLLDGQLKVLGRLSVAEWIALVSVTLFVAGAATNSLHRIAAEWIALTVLAALLVVEALNRKDFHEKVDWSFVLYLGGLVGLARSLDAVGLGTWLSAWLTWTSPLMRSDFATFVCVLWAAIGAVRLVIPNSACIAISATILLPVAETSGVNPWVVGFMILVFSDGWFFPYQCSYYLLFRDLTGETDLFDHRSLHWMSAISALLRLGAVYASLPLWRSLGLL